MSTHPHLTPSQIAYLRQRFPQYKSDLHVTTSTIAQEMSLENSTIAKRLKRMYGDEFSAIARKKCGWTRIVSDETVRALFEKYRNGSSFVELAKQCGLQSGSLNHRMRDVVGPEFREVSRIRKSENLSKSRQRVKRETIEQLFDVYKRGGKNLTQLAAQTGLAENSLIARFNWLYGKEYKEIAHRRRNERRMNKESCAAAFDEYRKTSISITALAERHRMAVSSLATRFRLAFPEEYPNVAMQKCDLVACDRRGKIGEEIAQEYLRLVYPSAIDVRRLCVLEGTLKRPDFLLDTIFIEVKTGYITMEGFGRIKGYRKIVEDYLGKRIRGSGKEITRGILVSFMGFSPQVREKAISDGILLIGKEEMAQTFADANREDLLCRLRIFS